nr:hypothetical protein [Candidatus Njordarchaeota archaeon]
MPVYRPTSFFCDCTYAWSFLRYTGVDGVSIAEAIGRNIGFVLVKSEPDSGAWTFLGCLFIH